MRTMIIARLALPAALLATLLATSPRARAETTRCHEITSVPAVIATQGVYCLKQNLSTAIASNPAIRIDTNNVAIDCNGHKLGGLAAGDGSLATGIQAIGRKNITIRNCSIRGFMTGVDLAGAGGGYHAIDGNSFDNNLYKAVHVVGDGSSIRRNQVRDTGGSTRFFQAYGIEVSGSGVEVVDNLVDGVLGNDANAAGIKGLSTSGLLVRGNRIRNVSSGTADPVFGITLSSSSSAAIIGNTVWASGALSAFGIGCGGTSSAARGNTVLDYSDANGNYACTELDNSSN